MLYFLWLPLLGIREFLSNYFLIDTLVLTIFINSLLFLDLILDINKNKFKVGFIFLFFIFSSIIVLLNKQALAFFNIMVAVYLVRNIPIYRILNILTLLSIFNIILFLFCSFFEIKNNEIIIMPKGDAYNIGFNNTNAASFFLMINLMVVVLWVYTKNKLISFIFLPLFYWIYLTTLSRTSFIAEIVFFIGIILNYFKLYGAYTKYMPIFLYFLLFLMTYLSRSYEWINELFTTRFFIYDSILSSFGILNFLFGFSIPNGQPMDSSFFSLLFDGGLLYVLIFLYIYNCYYNSYLKQGMYYYYPFVLFVLVAGFSENIFSSFNFISFIFLKFFMIRINNFNLWLFIN